MPANRLLDDRTVLFYDESSSSRKRGAEIMRIGSAGNTDIGRVRMNNEDSFLVDEALGLFAVADGMGGHAGGETASSMAVACLQETVRALMNRAETGMPPQENNAVQALETAFIAA